MGKELAACAEMSGSDKNRRGDQNNLKQTLDHLLYCTCQDFRVSEKKRRVQRRKMSENTRTDSCRKVLCHGDSDLP